MNNNDRAERVLFNSLAIGEAFTFDDDVGGCVEVRAKVSDDGAVILRSVELSAGYYVGQADLDKPCRIPLRLVFDFFTSVSRQGSRYSLLRIGDVFSIVGHEGAFIKGVDRMGAVRAYPLRGEYETHSITPGGVEIHPDTWCYIHDLEFEC